MEIYIAHIHTSIIYKKQVSPARWTLASLAQIRLFIKLDQHRPLQSDLAHNNHTINRTSNIQTASDTKFTNRISTMSSPVDELTESMASTTVGHTPGSNGKEKGANGYECRATQLQPVWRLLRDGEPVALDIEFQNYQRGGFNGHRVGRVAIVNIRGETVLDVYAAYRNEPDVKKKLPPRFLELGVDWADLKRCNGAVDAAVVENWVRTILCDRTVIMHDPRQDLNAFYLVNDVFSRSTIHDTQAEYSYLQRQGKPGLRTAASAVLGRSIQAGDHSPVEDATAAMDLWLMGHKWDPKAKKVVVREDEWERKNAHAKKQEEEHQKYLASLPVCEGCGERGWCGCSGDAGDEENETPDETTVSTSETYIGW